MRKSDKTERGLRYIERQKKELERQREQLIKQTKGRKEQKRIGIHFEMQKATSTPKHIHTEKENKESRSVGSKISNMSKRTQTVSFSRDNINIRGAERKDEKVNEKEETGNFASGDIGQESDNLSQDLGSLDYDVYDFKDKELDLSGVSGRIVKLLKEASLDRDGKPKTNSVNTHFPMLT